MSTPKEVHEAEIIFTKKRMKMVTEELINIFSLYRQLERHLLSETQKWQAAQLAESQGKTTEPCPVCQAEATCEHGVRDGRSGLFVHLWCCPECGDSASIVCYDCPDCATRDKAQAVTEAGAE